MTKKGDTLFIPYFNRDAYDYKRFFYAELPDKAKNQINPINSINLINLINLINSINLET